MSGNWDFHDAKNVHKHVLGHTTFNGTGGTTAFDGTIELRHATPINFTGAFVAAGAASAGAAILPATPQGFITFTVGGATTYKIPFYNA
jgi:hypothetical protein